MAPISSTPVTVFWLKMRNSRSVSSAAGLTWVGPPPDAMRLMGSKTESRKLAKSAGAPLIPGLMEPISEISELETFVDEHGLPVLLKAVAGGGGKGMRVVAERDELAGAYERACSEGKAYFGDARVYVERLVDITPPYRGSGSG